MVAVPLRSVAPARLAADSGAALRLWLGGLIFLVFLMVLVGGATRLTESGLSITEWQLVAGALPPLSESAWQAAFELYRASPQYELLNQGMNLDEYKRIYWWEWAHRELGRFIGLVFLAGFLWFALRRAVPARLLAVLTGLGLVLAMQGLVGWIMVASGLEPGMTAVAPVKLTLHLSLAALFFAALVTLFVRLSGAAPEAAPLGRRAAAWALVALAFLQIALGGLVAGHDAGLTYNTWPLMDGRLVPAGLGLLEPAWLNLIDNVTAIQFNHRAGAYLLVAAVLAYALGTRRVGPPARGRAGLIAALALAQTALGIATLVLVVPAPLALAHQGLAMILLLALVWNAAVLRGAPVYAAAAGR